MAGSILKSKAINPHAAAIVWNYVDRLATDGSKQNPLAAGQTEILPVILSDEALISVKTSKAKGTPAGSFELVLAPTQNWLTHLTAGSWIVVLMCQHKLTFDSINLLAKPDELKFLGRIESVRVHVEVDQTSGTRATSYIVTGKDWGTLLESPIYMDPVARDGLDSAVGAAARLLYENYLKHSVENPKGIPTSTANVRALLNFWTLNASAFTSESDKIPILLKAQATFSIPPQLASYLNLVTESNTPAITVGDLINLRTGKVNTFGDYTDVNDAVGIVRPDSLFGQHPIWQLMFDNCNDIINELLCDLDVSTTGTRLCIFKRIKPFLTRSLPSEASAVSNLASYFYDLPKYEIPIEDVVSVNAGTNWRDKFNYAEVLYDLSLLPDGARDYQIKAQSAIFDEPSFARDGFKPMINYAKYIAIKDGQTDKPDMTGITNWKYLLKEWYFNTHNMLNGAITIIGQDQYIQVGQNVMIDTRTLSFSGNSNDGDVSLQKDDAPSYMLAHVEGVGHEFRITADGARSFFTTIQFTRGIIVGTDGKPVGGIDGEGALSASSTKVGDSDLVNKNVSVTPSISANPTGGF